MPFNPLTKNQVRPRQWGQCARCGESLHDTEEFAHHLWPEILGGTDEEKNCVILCGTCHNLEQNDRSSVNCMLAPHSYFPHANIYGSHKTTQARAVRTR